MIREMIYEPRLKAPKLLHMDMYKGYEYIILSQGAHPCAYVRLPKDSKFYGCKEYFDSPLEDIDCHWGVTYSEPRLWWKNDGDYLCEYTKDMGWWFIGWDYSHHGDYSSWMDEEGLDWGHCYKRWTTTEIIAECRDVIEEIIKLERTTDE